MSWDKMDKKVWGNSEVMQEFEKNLLESAIKLASEMEKKAEGLKELSKDLSSVSQAAPSAAKGIKEVSDVAKTLYNGAEDEAANSLEEVADLIATLTTLSREFADSGDTALAYKLERTIKVLEDAKYED